MGYAIRITRLFLLSSAVILAGSACTTTDPNGNGDPPVATTIEIAPAAPNLDAIDATQQLTATVRDQNGDVMSGTSVTWSEADGTVATVSASGLVTAVANGTETITATSGNATADVTVTVQQVPAALAKIAGDGQTETVGNDAPTDLIAQVNDANDNPIEGVGIDIAVTQGGGSVAAATATSDAMGQVSTTWTLGTTAGAQEVTVSVTADASVNAAFAATAEPDVASSIQLVSGSGQSGLVNAPLSDPVIVAVLDQYDNGVPGVVVGFSGDGSFNPAAATTDAAGEASSEWTLSGTEGPQNATAASPGLTGSPLDFTATGGTLSVTAASPDPLVEGQTATLTGTGFDATPANNVVTVGGTVATVTAVNGAQTELTITVPIFGCLPARDVDVTVDVAGFSSNALTQALDPESFTSLAVGEQMIIQNPGTNDLCLQFNETTADEEYVIGIQSTGEVASALTEIQLTAVTPAGVPAPMMTPPLSTMTRGGGILQLNAAAQRRAAHREVEARIREFDRINFERMQALRPAANATTSSAAQAVPPTAMVGDQVPIRVIDINANPLSCDTYTEITTEVKAITEDGIWLHDIANPANGYTDQDYLDLADQFEDDIHTNNVAEFGEEPDRDSNNWTAIVITKEVNMTDNLLGFVITCDLFTRGTGAMGSNEGELFYGKAPDPNGDVNQVYPTANALADAPFVVAHEFLHVVQQGRRLDGGGFQMADWMAEGQATLAEEVVGLALESRSAGMDYGYQVALNIADGGTSYPLSIDWYQNGFIDIGRYFGLTLSNGKAPNSPHECGWLGRGIDGPCEGGRNVYGPPWSLLRYMNDRFRAAYPGNALQADMIDATSTGFTMLRNILATAGGTQTVPSLETLLAQWSAALYTDGRNITNLATELEMPSWDYFDIYHNAGTPFPANMQLTPMNLTFADFNMSAQVRDASTFYGLIAGGNRPATAIRARDGLDAALLDKMQMWVVRTR